MNKVVLYLHGKGGSADEAEHYRPLFPEYDVVGLDYQSHTPWDCAVELRGELDALKKQYDGILLIANSVGAFFAICAFTEEDIQQAWFISPIVDMERLILDLMGRAGVTEARLEAERTVETAFGEVLSWEYLRYVREHPLRWNVPTAILYGEHDALTSLETVTAFAEEHHAELTVMPGGEHWFHTEEQTRFLDAWISTAARDPFAGYIRQGEPEKREKAAAWRTAIGLQAVDGLKPSRYLLDLAVQNIEGTITLAETRELLNSYYQEKERRISSGRTVEADQVSERITEVLSEKAFSFTPNEYCSIHRRLFASIYPHAGKLRDYNITKKEWVLNGGTVLYGSASELAATLDYDLSQERNFSYRHLAMEEIVRHLAVFSARLWQIHPFGEGNTRTTAVFLIKYLRTLGFDVTNDSFEKHAWYFRNALVRANYNDLKNGVHETTEYLELFLRNLLLDERNELRSRTMRIDSK